MTEWRDAPDLHEVYQQLKQRGQIKAEIGMLENELKVEQARISTRKPRDTAARIIGIDDVSGALLIDLQSRITQLKSELEIVEAAITFSQFHRDMFKAIAYKERF